MGRTLDAGGRVTLPTKPSSETEFADAVAEVAHLYGWKLSHFRAARTVHGWRTPVAYDGKGWPDLCLIHPVRGLVWFRELKIAKRDLDDHQLQWKLWLAQAGANYDVWRPADWADIVAALSNGRAEATV
jgi:hypothetical protein